MIRHALAPVFAPAARSLELGRRLGPPAGGVCLTFDDGPHPEGTPAVLELLAQAGARATFFMVGEQVTRRAELVREVAGAGHAVAVHGYRHRLQPRLSASAVSDDMDRARGVIGEATGSTPELHRPPYGIYSPAGLVHARARGLRPLLWSRWGKDWRRLTTPARIAARVLEPLELGDVILLHDADFYSARNSHRRTVEALRMILAELGDREIATVLPI